MSMNPETKHNLTEAVAALCHEHWASFMHYMSKHPQETQRWIHSDTKMTGYKDLSEPMKCVNRTWAEQIVETVSWWVKEWRDDTEE